MAKTGMRLTVSGQTIEELKERLAAVAAQFGLTVTEGAAAPEKPAGTRGRKPKDPQPEAAQPTPAPAAPANGHANGHLNGNGHAKAAAADPFDMGAHAPAPAAAPTKEDLLAALTKLNASKGVSAVSDLLQKVAGVPSMSKVKPEDYQKVIAAANTATA